MKHFSVLVLLTAAVAFGQKVEETDKTVTLTGAWMQVNDPAASAGAYALSGNAGDTVTFNFTGAGVTLYRTLDPSGGMATVSIDGKAWGSIAFFFGTRAYQVPAVIDQLPAGAHQMVLTVAAGSPPGSTGTNVYIDAFESPITFAPTAAQQSALARVNLYRTAAGLPVASMSTAINLAAQAHSSWLGANNSTGHVETAGTMGFVGTRFGERLSYFGYDQAASEDWASDADPNNAVDQWLDSVYHRTPLMTFNYTDIGFGTDQAGGSTLDYGRKSGSQPTTRQITAYPANNQTNIPTQFGGGELPDPLAGIATYPTGFPISIHIDQPANVTPGTDTVVNTGTLTDAAGNVVAVKFLDRNSDTSGFLTGDDYFLMPLMPLAVSTTYKAQISGTDLAGNQFSLTWQFSTSSAATIVKILPFQLQSTSIWIQWNTLGAVTTTSVQYGPTTTYGTMLTGTPNNTADPLSVAVNLSGLTPGTVYHYLITATDAQGNTQTSGDRTFTTPAQ